MTLPLNRILYSYIQSKAKHTFIFIGGMHGNEPAGIYGLQRVVDYIEEKNIKLDCNFYAISGNINAFKKNIRYERKDLNRVWTNKNIEALKSGTLDNTPEDKEQSELFHSIKDILNTHESTFIFVDLHTTSSQTIPFITISDSLNNRKLAAQFSIPIILGIEEYLDGPLLTYINEFGHIALGFEAGQHEDKKAIDNCEAFIWLIIEKMKGVSPKDIPISKYKSILETYNSLKGFFEINYRYGLADANHFFIEGNFNNFEPILKDQPLARHKGAIINAQNKGLMFMPLYQPQGNDGFFIINKISKFWLQLSQFSRKLRLHHLLRLLPGIKQDTANAYTLIVNPKTAKFLATKLFHLFGYRKKIKKNGLLYFIKRDRKITPFG